ncbi:unnamed protein product [Arctia plantaginis]|uniref:RING-type domain-containing protein n=1 Tax=Arctia plantaginis TaxID=874455 RepID=A0A8S1BAS0_ARCPL|nr:unnamed protein product [Arctia plantaginis]
MRIYTSIVVFLICGWNFVSMSSVPVVRLNDGRRMPGLALGTWLGIDSEKNQKGSEVEHAVLWALAAGYTQIDTAFIYGIEDQIGRALVKKFAEGMKREDVYITTKLFNDAHAKDAVVPTLRKSLENLQLEYVDLYLIHFPTGIFENGTYDYTDYVETWRGMIEAKNLGLTKSIGVSNFNEEQINRLLEHGLEKPAALQVEVNLNLQQPALLSYCKEQDIAVMSYTPFGSLFYNKASSNAPPPRIDDPALVTIANKYNKTVPQITLRYLVSRPEGPVGYCICNIVLKCNININHQNAHVPLHFGHYASISPKAKKPSSIVTLGFTENNPSTLTRVPKISQLGRLPGYWVSELPIYFGYRLQFCVDSLGEIWFSDSQRTWTGPRVDRTNVSLWAVLSIPEHYFAEFDREAIPRRALSNVVPVREGQSSTHSIPSSSSRSARTLHQTETSSSSSKCIICCNKPTDTALSPCGHMYTCHDCALDLWQGRGRGSCPTCRKKITSVLRVYRD